MATDTAVNMDDNRDGGTTKRPRDSEVAPLLLPSLYRLTAGIPRRELKLMISEAKACEEALEREIKELEEGLKQQDAKSSSVDIMLETEVTPPDRYFTVSALLGRLRDDLAPPLPPNSTLPALRAQHGILQPATKKKKSNNPNDSSALAADAPSSDLEKQKRVLALEKNPEYTKEHPNPAVLLALWKKLSSHRTSIVFRRPVNPKEAPGYTERIHFPMDMSLARKMIVARLIKSYSDLHQRIGLICYNCVKYNGRESDYGIVTRDFEATADEFIVNAVAAASMTPENVKQPPTTTIDVKSGSTKPSTVAPVAPPADKKVEKEADQPAKNASAAAVKK